MEKIQSYCKEQRHTKLDVPKAFSILLDPKDAPKGLVLRRQNPCGSRDQNFQTFGSTKMTKGQTEATRF